MEKTRCPCNRCNIVAEPFFRNMVMVRDVDNKRLGVFCRECAKGLEDELKKERFVEEYKGNKTYL